MSNKQIIIDYQEYLELESSKAKNAKLYVFLKNVLQNGMFSSNERTYYESMLKIIEKGSEE